MSESIKKMPIKIKFGSEAKPKPPQARISLQITRTLDNNLLIHDHEYLDIVIVPSENKITLMPKPYVDKDIYDYQRDLMYDLQQKGILEDYPTGGPVFGMVEATYPKTSESGVDTLEALLYQLDKYLAKTQAEEHKAREYDENIEDNFTDPPADETTAYGEIPPYQDTPGANSIGAPTYTFAGYGYLY